MVVATALSAGSAVLGGIAQNNAAKQQAAVQRQQAEYAAQQHEFNAQRAAAGASGVDGGSGSALDLLRETSYVEEQDTEALRFNAMRARGGRLAEAQQSAWNAQATRIGGENAARATTNAGKSALWGSILGGASMVAGRWDYLAGGRKTTAKKKPAGSLSGGTGLYDSGYWG